MDNQWLLVLNLFGIIYQLGKFEFLAILLFHTMIPPSSLLVGIGRIGYPCNKLVWKRLSNVKKFKISIWINICSKFIDDGHGGVRQKLFQKEFGILINNKNPIYPGGLYKFAIYAYEVKHEAKFECGFISLNDGPLNCKLSINIKVF